MTLDPAVDLTLRAGLALLFATAAWHKLRAPRRFRDALAQYDVLPAAVVPVAAGALIAVEPVTAALLVTTSAAGPVAAATLLALYAVAIGVNLARGRRDLDCGCAGPAVRRPISGRLVTRNVALAALALVALMPPGARHLVWIDALTVIAATAALTTLYAAADRLLAVEAR